MEQFHDGSSLLAFVFGPWNFQGDFRRLLQILHNLRAKEKGSGVVGSLFTKCFSVNVKRLPTPDPFFIPVEVDLNPADRNKYYDPNYGARYADLSGMQKKAIAGIYINSLGRNRPVKLVAPDGKL